MGQRRDSEPYDCIIVGGGPGGLVSALYLGRYQRRVLVVNAGVPRARWIPRIRNLVGHAGGLSGPTLLRKLHEQLRGLHVDFLKGQAVVHRKGRGFAVEVDDRRFHARKVILATGMIDVQPDFPNFAELRARGLLAYCPICDGYDHSDETIAILVRDAHGLRKIPFIARFSKDLRVVLLHDAPIPAPHAERIRRLHLKVYRRIRALEAARDGRSLLIRRTGGATLRVRLAYVALGTKVGDAAFRHLRGLKRTREGYLRVNSHQGTTVPGLFAVGDCVQGLSQVSVAAGQAAIAATRVHHELGI